MEQTLLLNATYEPVKVIDWQRAMCLLTRGRVEVLETHDREARSVSFTFKIPAVVRLLRYVKIRRSEHVPFTRANIYARDGYQCQYCGEQFQSEDLTFDHVIPVSQGGTKSWDNIVSACVDCNRSKGNRTPEQAGMTLAMPPRRPPSIIALRLSIGLRKAPKSWFEYLYWNAELEQV